MYSNDKRHSCGAFQPNLYCLLQVLILLIVLSIIVQIKTIYELGVYILLIAVFLSIATIFYILYQRKRVMHRQKNSC